MRSKFNLYNVYDLGGNKILANVMAKEVCSFTGLPANTNLSYYYKSGHVANGKYRIEKSTEVIAAKFPKQRKPAEENICTKFTPSMLAEWRRMNERYGRKKA